MPGLLFLLVCITSFAVDLESAQTSAKEGRTDEAILAYRAWMGDNPDDPRTAAATLELVSLLKNLNEMNEALLIGLEVVVEPAVRHEILKLLAVTAERMGDLVSAERYYRDASFSVPDEKDFESLFLSALISFELGEFMNAEARARAIVETSKSREIVINARILLSRVYYATDRITKAFTILNDDGEDSNEGLNASGLFWLYRLSLLAGMPGRAGAARDALAARYPDSLERLLALGRIDRVPTPSVVLSAQYANYGGESDEAVSSTEAPTANVAKPTTPSRSDDTIDVQTGSFSVAENAEYAAKDLRNEGFNAAVEERKVGETIYFRVIVPDVPSESVRNVILNLKEKGFEGFPLYD